jgi:hypothetical protein
MTQNTFRRYHKDGLLPDEGEVFVFGSNLSGRHGAGAALVARHLGAKYGLGKGPCGKTYAIPTKGKRLEVLSITTIAKHVAEFVNYTKEHPEVSFFVTAVGCGLAGYKHQDIAPYFKEAINCSFPEEWCIYLEN